MSVEIQETIRQIVLVMVVLIPSVILHEISHGAAALAFGDDTAKRAGRLTLNPLPHIDTFGTVLLPALLAFTTGAAFGYAKPVPVNPARMRRPRDHGLVVSLVGPVVNIVLAVGTALVLRGLVSQTGRPLPGGPLVLRLLFLFGAINVVLAAFNLLPIPPLDGSAVVERFLPRRWLGAWHHLRRYSMLVILAVVLLLPGALDQVFDLAFELWALLL